jgi:hypothetical protein
VHGVHHLLDGGRVGDTAFLAAFQRADAGHAREKRALELHALVAGKERAVLFKDRSTIAMEKHIIWRMEASRRPRRPRGQVHLGPTRSNRFVAGVTSLCAELARRSL